MTRAPLMTQSLLALVLTLSLSGTLAARTIVLTAESCEQVAVLNAKAPRLSWACCQLAPGVYDTAHQLQMNRDMALLLQLPVQRIPKGQRITRAELAIKAEFVDSNPELVVRRLLTSWGPGVCHQYRMTEPRKLEWKQAGARGVATDRARRPSAVFKITAVGEYTADVTEDVELWYTGAVKNYGWVLSLDAGYAVYLPSPHSPAAGGGKQWKLRITYEPR